MKSRSMITVLLASLFLVFLAHGSASTASPVPPNPVLYLIGQESFSTGGKQFTRYQYDVLNKDSYPADLFAAAPNLPPCGTNTKSSRKIGRASCRERV